MLKTMRTKGLAGAIAVGLAALLALALMPIGAFAAMTEDTTGSLTLKGLASGDAVKIYKVVDTTYDADSNSISSKFADASGYGLDWDSYIAQASNSAQAKANADAIAAYIAANGIAATATATAAGESVVFEDLAMGQYLVVVTPSAQAKVFQNTIVSLVPEIVDKAYVLNNAEVTVKSSDVSIDKKVGGADSADTYAVGDKLPFTIEATVPSYPAIATNTTFEIGDVLSSGLALNDDVVVKVGDVSLVDGVDYTLAKTGTGFTVVFAYDKVFQYASQTVTVSYSATLLEAAVVTNPETNTASLKYATYPFDGASSNTIDDTTDITTYGVYLKKVDGADQAPLQGAEFALYKEDADGDVEIAGKKYRQVGTLESGADGYASCQGIGAGNYLLKEIKAPTGYVLPQNALKVTFSAGEVNAVDAAEYAKYFNYGNIENSKNPDLPVTGGMGTIIFTVVGVLLMSGAVALIVRSRREN